MWFFFFFFFLFLAFSLADFSCPVDGRKYLKRVARKTQFECPRGFRMYTKRDGSGDKGCVKGRTYIDAKPKYCCQHGEGVIRTNGRKYIIRRSADGSGRFCDIVSWRRLMQVDLRRQHVVGWDMDAAREAGEPEEGSEVIVPLPNGEFGSNWKYKSFTPIQ